MKLADTMEMMTSDNYRERFRAEYYQLDIRINGLKSMLAKLADGTLDFTPTCPVETYEMQLRAMEDYRAILVMRAKMEDIDL